MNCAESDDLDEAEKHHFYECKQCGDIVDKRQLDDVIFHQDHVHRSDIPYGASERLDKPTHGLTTLSRRIRKTLHVSALRKKLERIAHETNIPSASPCGNKVAVKAKMAVKTHQDRAGIVCVLRAGPKSAGRR